MSETGTITFVPSVHFSTVHRKRVRETIREADPDLVAVELDERRFERLDRNERTDPLALAAELPPPTAAAYATLQALQRIVVRFSGLDPTKTDMETAIETAAERNLGVALIDDPIAETMQALADRVGFETLPKLLLRAQLMGPDAYARQAELLRTPFSAVSHGDDVQPALDNLRQLLPEVAEVMIDRRDRSMARRLHRLRSEGFDVVAVIGAGHHNGIRRVLADLDAADPPDRAVNVPIRSPTRHVTRIPIE